MSEPRLCDSVFLRGDEQGRPYWLPCDDWPGHGSTHRHVAENSLFIWNDSEAMTPGVFAQVLDFLVSN